MSNVYRYMSDADLLRLYQRLVKKSDRQLRAGYPARAADMLESAKGLANEMDSRKERA